MDKSEIRVFIVDDDPTLGKALKELVQKMGFKAVLCTTPTEAESQFRIQGGQLLVVDCLLPKMSGLDLALKLKKETVEDVPTVLMSGIYKDKTFMKDALHKTGAIAFFSKPFDLSEFETVVYKAVERHIDEGSPVESLLTANPSPHEKIQILNALGTIEALDIPWLSCALMNGGITGTMNLTGEREAAAIHFAQGKVVQVDMPNPASFFGALLIEKGFLTPEQLDVALQTKSPKKLGERLVDMNMLSPHVIHLTNAEQTAIRLSRVISENTYTVKFVEQEVLDTPSSIDTESIASFLVDWLNSKFSLNWLQQRYMKWVNSPIVVNDSKINYTRLWTLPPLKNVPDLISDMKSGLSLAQILDKGKHPEELIYQVFHLLILIGQIRLTKEVKQVDEAAQMARLEKIWRDMQQQDLFSMLGVPRNSRTPDVKKTYYELAKIFHPDRVPSNASNALKELAKQVFSHMTSAYETLADDNRRATYLKELDLGRAEKILQSETLLEEGKAALKAGQAKKAKDRFEAASKLRPPNSELLIHYAWAKMLGEESSGEKNLLEVEATLNRIPPEDRHNANYYFVKGLFQQMIGDDAPAIKNVQHALALNPKFLEAERLLRALEQKKNQKIDIFKGDLGSVVNSIFKKK